MAALFSVFLEFFYKRGIFPCSGKQPEAVIAEQAEIFRMIND
jgi:hypothetical protein